MPHSDDDDSSSSDESSSALSTRASVLYLRWATTCGSCPAAAVAAHSRPCACGARALISGGGEAARATHSSCSLVPTPSRAVATGERPLLVTMTTSTTAAMISLAQSLGLYSLAWAGVFGLFRLTLWSRSHDLCNRMVSVVHAVVSIVLCSRALDLSDPFKGLGGPNTPEQVQRPPTQLADAQQPR